MARLEFETAGSCTSFTVLPRHSSHCSCHSFSGKTILGEWPPSRLLEGCVTKSKKSEGLQELEQLILPFKRARVVRVISAFVVRPLFGKVRVNDRWTSSDIAALSRVCCGACLSAPCLSHNCHCISWGAALKVPGEPHTTTGYDKYSWAMA